MSFFRLCLDGNRTKLASMANGNWHVIISKLHNEVLTSFTCKRHDSKLIITHLQIKTSWREGLLRFPRCLGDFQLK